VRLNEFHNGSIFHETVKCVAGIYLQIGLLLIVSDQKAGIDILSNLNEMIFRQLEVVIT
jgi:hypothetical protein